MKGSIRSGEVGPIEDPGKGSGEIDDSAKSSIRKPRGMQQISSIRRNIEMEVGGGEGPAPLYERPHYVSV